MLIVWIFFIRMCLFVKCDLLLSTCNPLGFHRAELWAVEVLMFGIILLESVYMTAAGSPEVHFVLRQFPTEASCYRFFPSNHILLAFCTRNVSKNVCFPGIVEHK